MGRILDEYGRPFANSRSTADVDTAPRVIRARYDAAQTTTENQNHWAPVDAYSADAANSLAIRSKIAHRARHETENNGHGKGIVLTHAAYVVGRGPLLRMRTTSPGFNAMVESAWAGWCKAVKFARKLRTAHKAKTRDGEGILIARENPGVRDLVKLDIVGIECEQMQSPFLYWPTVGQVDGVHFDEFGNPTEYEVLPYHPGSFNMIPFPWRANKFPAKYVYHMFREDRPGQHRAVSELSSTLGLFAQGRRYREAVVAAAETAADFALVIKTNAPPDSDPQPIAPFSTMPIDKRMVTAMPFQWDPTQLKAEQPTTGHSEFVDVTLSEEARPLSMPRNIAGCDSSGYSFSGGRLDHLTYFVAVDVDQQDIEDCCLDPLFSLWFEVASLIYGWVPVWTEPGVLQIPPHDWAWPPRPKIDDGKTAAARQTDLATGVSAPSDIATEDGRDWEDHVQQLAADYGKTVDEIKQALFEKHLGAKTPPQPGGQAGQSGDAPTAEDMAQLMRRSRNQGNGNGKANGRARV